MKAHTDRDNHHERLANLESSNAFRDRQPQPPRAGDHALAVLACVTGFVLVGLWFVGRAVVLYFAARH